CAKDYGSSYVFDYW
nr:immunoglobulin heavy chain junction region [Mus musculus]MBK4189032.1 immunoglobulin heavy chain junction region [Mus musculus]